MSVLIGRRPWMVSYIRRAETPMSLTRCQTLMPRGARNSSNKILPGGIGKTLLFIVGLLVTFLESSDVQIVQAVQDVSEKIKYMGLVRRLADVYLDTFMPLRFKIDQVADHHR